MKLRTQLGFFCLGMAGIIGAMGALTVWGGSQVIETFSSALSDMERVSQVRSLQVLLTRQKASLDTYFLVADAQELERFEEMSRLVSARLKDMDNAPLNKQYQGVLDAARAVVDLYKTDKERAFKQATDILLPKVGAFFEAVNTAEDKIAEEVKTAQADTQQIVRLAGRSMLYLSLFGAVTGFLFAVITFRSMTRSLRLLQEGTAAFGGGQWDYQIELNTKDELGLLARSFNEMAQNIKQLESQTVHMHRMSAVGQLAGGVAHEINNPLTGVLGQAQILLDKLAADDPHRSHIEKIERAAVRCKRIVRSLLDFSRQKETQFTYLNINEVVEGTVELCEPDLQSNRVSLIKNLNLAVPSIMGNAPQLQQVFLNLATNAIQAMSQGGSLTVSTRATSFVAPNDPSGRKAEAVEISFSDTGMGINQEHLPHVFEPFFTTKEIGKGTGLGLSVSLGIVRNHGGDIKVESQGTGRGATFRVILPMSMTNDAANATPQESRFGPGPNTRY